MICKHTTPLAQPFLKWAGGKRQLLPQLVERLPQKFNRYFEPFLGGGALFFEIANRFGKDAPQSFLSDISKELINVYRAVRLSPEELMRELDRHSFNQQYYYRIRALDRSAKYSKLSSLQRASRFIFLNKTCFNGLHRVNSSGHFNVPYGKYARPRLYDRENLARCSAALKKASVSARSFSAVMRHTKAKDFVYLDPPYAPLNPTSNFTSYTSSGFAEREQRKLFEFCQELDRKKVKFLLSNSSAQSILDLYGSHFDLDFVPVSRAINSVGTGRGRVSEVLVRNFSG